VTATMPSPGRRSRRQDRSFLLLSASLAVLAACATPKPPPPAPSLSVFVLLPEADGRTGQITVTNASGQQVLTGSREASRVAGAGSAPSAPVVLGESEIQQLFGPALAALPPEPVHFILYFKGDSDELTAESQALLPQFLQLVRERSPADVSIVGHTDTVGTQRYNYDLGLRRAGRVADLLVAQGVDRATLDIDSHGKDDLLVKTGDQVSEPQNRRVEIIVR
jgi:outer membrane protein OmpA-like peptidoglycan-associated protein